MKERDYREAKILLEKLMSLGSAIEKGQYCRNPIQALKELLYICEHYDDFVIQFCEKMLEWRKDRDFSVYFQDTNIELGVTKGDMKVTLYVPVNETEFIRLTIILSGEKISLNVALDFKMEFYSQ